MIFFVSGGAPCCGLGHKARLVSGCLRRAAAVAMHFSDPLIGCGGSIHYTPLHIPLPPSSYMTRTPPPHLLPPHCTAASWLTACLFSHAEHMCSGKHSLGRLAGWGLGSHAVLCRSLLHTGRGEGKLSRRGEHTGSSGAAFVVRRACARGGHARRWRPKHLRKPCSVRCRARGVLHTFDGPLAKWGSTFDQQAE